jgi:hypothetical protein
MEDIFEGLLQLVFELVLEFVGEAVSATAEYLVSTDLGKVLASNLPIPALLSGEVITLDIQNHKGRIS